jgi:hypothetical protein
MEVRSVNPERNKASRKVSVKLQAILPHLDEVDPGIPGLTE